MQLKQCVACGTDTDSKEWKLGTLCKNCYSNREQVISEYGSLIGKNVKVLVTSGNSAHVNKITEFNHRVGDTVLIRTPIELQVFKDAT